MSQSTTRQAFNWMDLERREDAELHPGQARVQPSLHGRLAALRSDTLRAVVAALRDRGRTPRVCLYALSIGGTRPSSSLEGATAFAVRNGWQVGGDQQIFTDHHGAPDPESRTGWELVRRQVRAGYADGVVVATTSVISSDPEEYERELRWFDLHRAFIAVVAPAAQVRL